MGASRRSRPCRRVADARVEKAKDAPNLASTLNIGAFNIGNAGGAVLTHGYGLDALHWAVAVVAVAALAVTWFAARLNTPRMPTNAKVADEVADAC